MRIIPTILFAALLTATAAAERRVDLGDVLAANRSAVGAPIHGMKAALTIVEPGFTVTASYVASRDKRMRIDVYAGEDRVFSEWLDGDVARALPGGAAVPEAVSDAGREALWRGIVGNLYGLHERSGLGYRLSLDGDVTENRRRYWRVRSVAPNGFEELYFIDVETALVSHKREVSALHPDVDSRAFAATTWFMDYQEVDGRMFSMRSEKRTDRTGELIQTSRIDAIEIDPVVNWDALLP